MALTYQLIASNTLTSSAASVTFSSIPQTYTDLVLRVSARCDRATVNSQNFYLQINSTTFDTNYSFTKLYASGTTTSSSRFSSDGAFYGDEINAVGSTSNTFNSVEIYVPNYAGTTTKPISSFGVTENNSSTGNTITAVANLYSGTSAITSIIFSLPTGNFVSGSTFWLYGIKKD